MTDWAGATVPEPRARRASIVIPTLGGPLILQCLESLQKNITAAVDYEVVVVANGPSADGLADAAAFSSPSVRLVTSAANLGFGGGCNRGAAETSGEFLVFLNDDVEVLPGWLEALVETADLRPDVGALGSLILSPDGRVLEAGSIVWRDGSTVSVGRGASVEDNPYNFQRSVDYCSACSMMVRRQPWEAVGGFDRRYFPAYYEDVDLCFELARAGFRTMFEPRSRVIHRESASSSLTRKVFLSLRNRETFLRKWAREVAACEPPAPTDPRAVARAVEKSRGSRRLLMIDDRPPQRGSGSGFSVLLDAIEALDDTGYAVSVAASDRIDGDLAALSDLGVHVMRQPPDTVLSDLGQMFDRVLISRPNNFQRYAPLVRQFQPQASLVYLTEALYYRRMQRQLELATDPVERERQAAEMLEWRRLERTIPLQADEIICVSDEEAAILASVAGHCPIEVVRPIVRGLAPTVAGFSDRADLLFTPGWLAGDVSPNVDALRWFVIDVLPRLLEVRPDIRLRVTGGNPPPAARALAGAAVDLLGFTPELRSQYEAARVAIVPMRFGAGVKLKCLEALQYGVPVVSTSVGAEGLGLHDSRAVVVTDDPRDFAASLLRLYESPEAWTRQRGFILRVIERWREQQGPTWRQVLAPSRGEHRDASGNFSA
jgi:GT2 family glycosyltransferase